MSKYKDKLILDIICQMYVYWPDTGHFYKNLDYNCSEIQTSKFGYKYINYKKKRYFIHKLVYHMMGFDVPNIVDHINQDKLDNKWTNLRSVDKRQNNTNQKTRKDNSSGYKGVYYHKSHNKWMARISHHGKMKFLGYADSPLEAAKIYNKAVPLYHGEHGWVNDLG